MTAASASTRLAVHPDRLFPADEGVRSVARRLYAEVAEAPIFSPHGHVEAELLSEDRPFRDPTQLLITPDHYVTRVLHSRGVPLDELGLGVDPDGFDARRAWRTFCEHWDDYLGTPSRFWLEWELAELFSVSRPPSARDADLLYDEIVDRLGDPAFRPRALLDRFGIDTLATTDDPCADLSAHAALSAAGIATRVIPTFRPDAYLDPSTPGWQARIARLTEVSGVDATRYRGFLDALRARRRHFVEHGATATDHGVVDAGTRPLGESDAARLHDRALLGGLDPHEATAYRRNLLFEMARMSTEDGLVMQLHPGVLRNHHRPTSERFGPDTGHDIPLTTAFVEPLRPLLEAFGTDPRLRIVLFTVDETTFSREIAPLAGFYPSVFVGAPWWFLDAPDAIARFRAAVTETAGFFKMAGFVDDTRALCSIPARHDMSRRLDASYLARLVAEHRIDEDEAARVLRALVVELPRAVFSRTVP